MPRWKNALQTNQDIQRLKREAVLKEAGRAFGKSGYHNTSLDDVAKTLQVSKGTLYNYVKDKQEILAECHNLALSIGDRAVADGRAQGGTGAQVLRNTIIRYIELLLEDLGACSVLMEVDALRPKDRTKVVSRRNGFERDFVAMVEAGIRDGSIRAIDPKLAVFTFMGAINWLPRWYSAKGRFSAKEVSERMTDLLLSGLLTGDEEKSALPAKQGRAKATRSSQASPKAR